MVMQNYEFIDKDGSFRLKGAENDRELYFPIAGEHGLKSAITPNLCGDAKLDQNHFLLEPQSVGDLAQKRISRNFWCMIKERGVWSATGMSAKQEAQRYSGQQEESCVEAGYMWHKAMRRSKEIGIEAEITSFVPVEQNVEIMHVKLHNITSEPLTVTAIAAIPIYGRSADNIRDHRHVTSLLHRAYTTEYGVHVTPTLSFDERGHQKNDWTYYVEGMTAEGEAPESFYPEQEAFIGRGGTLLWPEAVVCNRSGVESGRKIDGQETLGGLRFAEKTLQEGESCEYTLLIGAIQGEENIARIREQFSDSGKVSSSLKETRQYWKEKNKVHYHTADPLFDQFMNWVNFQPELRRIYGCSFLPHHDYGKGGRGWRDLWQDCLALLLMDPASVRNLLVSNFAGVRVDGTNATIIGEHMGEFKADRNGITRVWMDHGVWPFMTTKLYLEQTGDSSLLYENVPYFKDAQVMRGTAVDEAWEGEVWQKDAQDNRYEGTVLEHLLVQALCAFYEVGEHNHIRLRDADWNDAIDMASHRGESVAFTNSYAKNLMDLGHLLLKEKEKGVDTISLFWEMAPLLRDEKTLYDDIEAKKELLKAYIKSCSHQLSGEVVLLPTEKVAKSLLHKAEWMIQHIRHNEWIEADGHAWYNSYYDDHGRRVEGRQPDGNVRMMLTGQVFSIMAGTAEPAQILEITKAADRYLFDASCGGYRLNTDFHEVKTDMGRMFGFAYGEKENGAVFSHMAVMYANALYERGYAKEGYKALHALYHQAMDFENSRIYPGIPEYFGKDGRGLYHYLTGAASWYMLTVITCMFGIRGEEGALVIAPNLLKEQFDETKKAEVTLPFQGILWQVTIENPKNLEAGTYEVREALLDHGVALSCAGGNCRCDRKLLETLDVAKTHEIHLTLAERSADR